MRQPGMVRFYGPYKWRQRWRLLVIDRSRKRAWLSFETLEAAMGHVLKLKLESDLPEPNWGKTSENRSPAGKTGDV
jgi:hypothetical protein